MWIKRIPEDYHKYCSYCYHEVFLWRAENVFVMDNHKSALWCWLHACEEGRKYNFMHIDRHYDMLECFHDKDLKPLKRNPHLDFDTYSNLIRIDDDYKVFRWDNYIMAGYVLRPDWFHTNIFLTHKEGYTGKSWGHKPMRIREENPLFMEWSIQQYIEEPSEFLDGFEGDDFKLPWIVNLDIDVFYTADSHIQLFSDEYIRKIAEILQRNLERIAVLTIAVSPDCLGGDCMSEKWANGFRILKIMSEEITCLKEFVAEVEMIKTDGFCRGM